MLLPTSYFYGASLKIFCFIQNSIKYVFHYFLLAILRDCYISIVMYSACSVLRSYGS